ncbi:MAG: helix-turn-helix domain-containing protein [Acidobacteriaceae bacterium]
MRSAAKPARPDWTIAIGQVRESLGIGQAGLARLLNVSPMAVSRWERGVNQPTASIYIMLGKLAGPPQCWYFWQRAGLTREDLLNALNASPAAK